MTAVKSGYVMNNGNPLNYQEWGDPDAPSIVMIPAIRHSAYEWLAVAQEIAKKYRVIGVNLCGHGDSGPFPKREYNPDFYVDDLRAFVEGLGLGPTVVLGFSVVASGAAVGFAAAHPDLARAVVLVDGGPGYRQANVEEAGARVRSVPAYFDSWDEALAFYSKSPDQLFTTPEMRADRAPYIFRKLPDGRVTWKHDEILRQQWPGEEWQRNTGKHTPETWAKVQCPVFVMKSAATTHLSEEDCDALVKNGKDSEWIKLEGGKTHFAYEEIPDKFIGAVNYFMGKVY